jgi:threonine synthase
LESEALAHYVAYLEGARDGARFPYKSWPGPDIDQPVLVRYDLEKVRLAVSPQQLALRPPTLWRYRELLPLPTEVEPVSLGEGWTPLIECPRLATEFGLQRLLVKDESQLPSGSFKSRGMSVAVSMAKWLGARRVAIPSAGNAGGALALYAARAGLEAYIFMPVDTPRINILEASLAGGKVYLVPGLISDCARLVRLGVLRFGWLNMSTLREPYRVEGKKTMGLELVEQLGWQLPDVILYPTGGGTGLIGMWKALEELRQLGWLKGEKLPRFYACQSDGCAPIVRAFEKGQLRAEPIPNPQTEASGLRVPEAFGDFLILDAVRKSGGAAIAGRETNIRFWMQQVARLEGLAICPEAAVCFDALQTLIENQQVRADETVVIFNTAAAQKYPQLFETTCPVIRSIEEFEVAIGTASDV